MSSSYTFTRFTEECLALAKAIQEVTYNEDVGFCVTECELAEIADDDFLAEVSYFV